MNQPIPNRSWTRHFIYRREQTRTTWKLRVGLPVLVAAALWLTAPSWTSAIAVACTCDANRTPADAIVVENFDFNYFVFERASELRHAGVAARVLVPVGVDANTSHPSRVALATTEVMAQIAHLGPVEIVPVREVEPISLNVARDLLRFVERERIRSVIVVAPLFRSRRSALVYAATLGEAGVKVACEPARSMHGVDTWTRSWHGIQDVMAQWSKLQYYRLYVLPFRSHTPTAARQ